MQTSRVAVIGITLSTALGAGCRERANDTAAFVAKAPAGNGRVVTRFEAVVGPV